MLPSGPRTADDLDALGSASFDAGDPLALAAEIVARDGTLEDAEILARRAAETEREQGTGFGYPQAFHAELLLQLGREDEGSGHATGRATILACRTTPTTTSPSS